MTSFSKSLHQLKLDQSEGFVPGPPVQHLRTNILSASTATSWVHNQEAGLEMEAQIQPRHFLRWNMVVSQMVASSIMP